MTATGTGEGQGDPRGDLRRRLAPEDQVPARYREVERLAYSGQRDQVPAAVVSIGRAGAAGHVGDGLWHPSELHPDYVSTADRPSGRDVRRATGAALRFLRQLGYLPGEDQECLSALRRWCRGEYSGADVAAMVDGYARRPEVRYRGAIVRAIDLPVFGRHGWPDVSLFDARAGRHPETMLVERVAEPLGLAVGQPYSSPVPRSFSASAAVEGNLYEVLTGDHTGASVRAFSALWAQDEVVLPANSVLVPERLTWHVGPGGAGFVVVYLRQLDGPNETVRGR